MSDTKRAYQHESIEDTIRRLRERSGWAGEAMRHRRSLFFWLRWVLVTGPAAVIFAVLDLGLTGDILIGLCAGSTGSAAYYLIRDAVRYRRALRRLRGAS